MKKILNFLARHKVLTIMLIAFFIARQFVAISLLGNIPTVTFDRWHMNRVNRIEVETSHGTTIINDQRLINSIVSATMTAQDLPQCLGTFGWNTAVFRLYRNNVLIRDMELEFKHYQMRVYFPSQRHWLFGYSREAFQTYGGVIPLSRELITKIDLYLQGNGNSLF